MDSVVARMQSGESFAIPVLYASERLPPAMQRTVRTHAERMVVLSRPGAKVCRNVPVGIAQVDLVSGVVLTTEGDRVRIRIEGVGRLNNQPDGRVIAPGDEILEDADRWFACR